MIHVGQAAGEWFQFQRMSVDERRLYWLNNIQQRRQLVWKSPINEWGVYELCKSVYELAEIDHVDFNGADYLDKMKLIRSIIPFASPEALIDGVMEYHESRMRQNWGMSYLMESVTINEQPTGL